MVTLATTSLPAQVVRGRVIGPDGGGVSGAIVTLVDSTGTLAVRVLSSPLGSYLLRAPAAGRYSLRVLRIGFPAFTAPAMQLAAGSAIEYTPTLPDDPIILTEIEVTAGGGCSTGAEGGATATLLEEVRKAFSSADLALQDRGLRFEVMRRVRRTGLHVEHFEDSVPELLHSWPVHSLPAEQLRDRGFVQSADSVDPRYMPLGSAGRVWFGPDPVTLFSQPFLESHCYTVRRDHDDPDRVGLSFKPARGRRLSDIEGTLWLSRRTLALERIEYEYVNLPRHLTRGTAGRPKGSMELLRLPTGLWIVSRWSLTAPVEQVRDNAPVGIAGWLEQTGEIRRIRTTQGAVIF